MIRSMTLSFSAPSRICHVIARSIVDSARKNKVSHSGHSLRPDPRTPGNTLCIMSLIGTADDIRRIANIARSTYNITIKLV